MTRTTTAHLRRRVRLVPPQAVVLRAQVVGNRRDVIFYSVASVAKGRQATANMLAEIAAERLRQLQKAQLWREMAMAKVALP